MTKKHLTVQTGALSASRVDEILHAIALALARRQMEQAWPSIRTDRTAIA